MKTRKSVTFLATEADGEFTAKALNLPIHTQGVDKSDLLKNALDAAEAHLGYAVKVRVKLVVAKHLVTENPEEKDVS